MSVRLNFKQWQFVAAALVLVEAEEGSDSPGKGWLIKDEIEKQLGRSLSYHKDA